VGVAGTSIPETYHVGASEPARLEKIETSDLLEKVSAGLGRNSEAR